MLKQGVLATVLSRFTRSLPMFIATVVIGVIIGYLLVGLVATKFLVWGVKFTGLGELNDEISIGITFIAWPFMLLILGSFILIILIGIAVSHILGVEKKDE